MRHVIAILLMLSCPALARDDGRFADVDPVVREWFRSQRVPGGSHAGTSCCTEADGVYAEEDIRAGQFWFRYQTREGRSVDWTLAGPDQLITTPNKHGRAVVW